MAKSSRHSSPSTLGRSSVSNASADGVVESVSQPSRTAGSDVALLCGKTADGRGLHVLRKRQDKLEAGIVTPLEEGKPLHGELVTLKPRAGSPVCDVEVHYRPGTSARETKEFSGPPQVASDAYRENWDTIWKRRTSTTSGSDKALLN